MRTNCSNANTELLLKGNYAGSFPLHRYVTFTVDLIHLRASYTSKGLCILECFIITGCAGYTNRERARRYLVIGLFFGLCQAQPAN